MANNKYVKWIEKEKEESEMKKKEKEKRGLKEKIGRTGSIREELDYLHT